MAQFSSFRDIIGLWHTLGDFAADLGVPYQTAAAMRARDSIAAGHWPVVIEKARDRKFRGVTLEVLTGLERARELRRQAKRQRAVEAPARHGSAA